jgi:hypothetical protein
LQQWLGWGHWPRRFRHDAGLAFPLNIPFGDTIVDDVHQLKVVHAAAKLFTDRGIKAREVFLILKAPSAFRLFSTNIPPKAIMPWSNMEFLSKTKR